MQQSNNCYDEELIQIRMLLDANADINITIKKAFPHYNNNNGYENQIIIPGDTPLHNAIRIVRIGRIHVVQLLIEYHPNVYICNENNETVLDIANKQRLYKIIRIIEDNIRYQIYKYLLYSWGKNIITKEDIM